MSGICPALQVCCILRQKTKYIEKFKREFDAAKLPVSLIENMAAIQRTDYHVVCNSTFSIMSAIMCESNGIVIPLSKYFSGIKTLPDDAFPEKWFVCEARRSPVFCLDLFI